MKEKYYYHITDKEHLPAILKFGLKPMIGENSNLVNETNPAIYLCRRKDIPYWKILLGKTVVLRIEGIEIPNENCYKYSNYSEYLYFDDISADKIKRVYFSEPSKQAMRNLCLSYISSFNQCAVAAARHYTYPDQGHDERLECLLNVCLAGARKLDYSVLTQGDLRKELKEWGDNCAYTFVDMYMNSGKRLYQKLVEYLKDRFS